MKIAIALHGLFGGIEGRHRTKSKGQLEILNKSFESINTNLIEPNCNQHDIDFYCHSWSTEMEAPANSLYGFKDSIFEADYDYHVPSELKLDANNDRVHGLFHKWKSFEKSLKMIPIQDYDYVVSYRTDIYLLKPQDISSYDTSKLYMSYWKGNKTSIKGADEYNDHIIGIPIDLIDDMANLHDNLKTILLPNKCIRPYSGNVSNHAVLAYHINHNPGLFSALEFDKFSMEVENCKTTSQEDYTLTRKYLSFTAR